MLDFAPGYSQYRSGPAGQGYNESAFRHFLAIDRRRAERSTRSLLLVLVSIRQGTNRSARLSEATATAVFTSLGECVREIDFVGWYRQGCIPAAVLAQNTKVSVEVRDRMLERIMGALKKRLPVAEAHNLHVRVLRLGGRVRR